MKKNLFLLFLLIAALATQAQEADWTLKLSSNVFLRTWKLTSKADKEEGPVGNASIVLYKGTAVVGQTSSNGDGEFSINVPGNGLFTLKVSYPGCNTKSMEVDTRNVPQEMITEKFEPTFRITGGFIMVKPFPGIDYSGLQNNLIRVEWMEKKKAFDDSEEFTETGLQIVSKIYNAEDALIKNFCSTNKAGDIALAKPDCPLAKQLYEKAISIIPGEPYPVEQLVKVGQCLKDKEDAAKKAAEDAAKKAEAEKQVAAKAAADKEAARKAADEKVLADKAAKEKAVQDEAAKASQTASEKEAAKKAAEEAAAVKKAEKEKQMAERAEAVKAAKEKDAADREAKKKESEEKLAKQKEARDKAAAEKSLTAQTPDGKGVKIKNVKVKEKTPEEKEQEEIRKKQREGMAASKAEDEAAMKADAEKAKAKHAEKEKARKEREQKEGLAKAKAEDEAEAKAIEEKKRKQREEREAQKKLEYETKAKEDQGEMDKGDSKYKTPQVLGANKYKEVITKADGYFKTKRYAEARDAYKEALVLKPGDTYATSRLAETEKLIAPK